MPIKWGPKDVLAAFQKELQYTPTTVNQTAGSGLLNTLQAKAKGLFGAPKSANPAIQEIPPTG
jgi:hypothetical protein